jgi:uncharacterized protein (DUF1800 family)
VKLPKRKTSKTSRKTPAKPRTTCRTVRDKRTGRRRKVCTPAKRRRTTAPKPAPVPKALPMLPVPSAAAPPVAAALAPPAPVPAPASGSSGGGGGGGGGGGSSKPKPPPALPAPPTPVHGTLSRRDAERLLWRAGFGPRRGEAARLAGRDALAAVQTMTRVSGAANLEGAAPRDEDGNGIDPNNAWGHDHVWWLDRMVRSDQQLVERMALVWHDWFATTNNDVGNQRLMMAQNELFRTKGLGSFLDLALAVTRDPAMLQFLNGIENHKWKPNENYARELMELFTLGADRGAYTEDDVRELARALTGWRATWSDDVGMHDFRFDPNRHDTGTKTLWAGTAHERSGAFGWEDAVRLCLEHPMHRSFFVRKLWGAFVPTPPDAGTQAALEGLYWNSGFEIRPVVEAILAHPDLYGGPPMVKPPAVYTAGLLRARGQTIRTAGWAWLGGLAGQQLFYPPNVAGWNDQAWLDTATIRGRWYVAYTVLEEEYVDPWPDDEDDRYSATETPDEAVAKALAFWDDPALSDETRAELDRFAAALPTGLEDWRQGAMRAERQNALRHLVATAPDFHTS